MSTRLSQTERRRIIQDAASIYIDAVAYAVAQGSTNYDKAAMADKALWQILDPRFEWRRVISDERASFLRQANLARLVDGIQAAAKSRSSDTFTGGRERVQAAMERGRQRWAEWSADL